MAQPRVSASRLRDLSESSTRLYICTHVHLPRGRGPSSSQGPFVTTFRAPIKSSPHSKVFPVKGTVLLSQVTASRVQKHFIACFVIIQNNSVNISPFSAVMNLIFVSGGTGRTLEDKGISLNCVACSFRQAGTAHVASAAPISSGAQWPTVCSNFHEHLLQGAPQVEDCQ